MMLGELSELFEVLPPTADREQHAAAIVEENVLGKSTAAGRRGASQRLRELYALDPTIALYRVLRRVWEIDAPGRPLIALLGALARDPLLRATAAPVLGLQPGCELSRASLLSALTQATGDRLNGAILDKVARNAASSWAQSGHLAGRVRKVRQRVNPTPGSIAMAMWLGSVQGGSGEELLHSSWARVLDRSPSELLGLVLRAKQHGFLDARVGGGVVEIDARGLDPLARRARDGEG